MKYLITFMVALIATTGFSQTAIDKYFADFDSDDSFTSISISGKMFQLLTHIEGETDDEKEILETVSKLEGMKMLVKERVAPGEGMYRSAINRLGSEFEELMRVEDKEENLIFFIRETNGQIRELVLIGSGEDELFIMSLIGDIDLNQIAKIGRAIEVDGFEHLEKIGDAK